MDCCKVLVPLVILQLAFHPEKPLLFASSIAGVVGHDFSIFLRFRSGKGVASTMGVFFALNPIAGSIFLGSSLLLFAKTRLVSLSTMSGMVLATISSLFLFSDLSYFFLFLGLTLLSIFRHKKNIQRLIKGEEKRLTEKKKNP
jgi:glycerol-3-phosphate acyltransferase PlsY